MSKPSVPQGENKTTNLEARVERLEEVLTNLLHSYNGQIKAAKVGADAFNPSMAEVEGL